MENADPRNLETAHKYFVKAEIRFSSTDDQKVAAKILADTYRHFCVNLKSAAERIKHLEMALKLLNKYNLNNVYENELIGQELFAVAEKEQENSNNINREETALGYFQKAVSFLEKGTSKTCLVFLSCSYARIGIITQNIETINKALIGFEKAFNLYRETHEVDIMLEIEREQKSCAEEKELIQAVSDNDISKILPEVLTQFKKISKNCTAVNIEIRTSGMKKELLVHYCEKVLKMEPCDVEYANDTCILTLYERSIRYLREKISDSISKKP